MTNGNTRRKQTFQNVSWFLDLRKRGLLNLDPPYQRWSVWSRTFKEEFIDTILLGYPSPALFLFRQVSPDGTTTYDVVDGKQRLTSIFEFTEGMFPVAEKSPLANLRGMYFNSLSTQVRLDFFDYDFSVEYLPSNRDDIVSEIFNRLNKNTARLQRQELRHAKFSGEFIEAAESLSLWTWGGIAGEGDTLAYPSQLPQALPRFSTQSRRQMKDIEMVATLLLLIEEGVKGHSADALDAAFSSREEWEKKAQTTADYEEVIGTIHDWIQMPEGQFIVQSRLRNQADFYSLFGAILELSEENVLPKPVVALERLKAFIDVVENEDLEQMPKKAREYYEAARSASSDVGPRRRRIDGLKVALSGEPLDGQDDPA